VRLRQTLALRRPSLRLFSSSQLSVAESKAGGGGGARGRRAALYGAAFAIGAVGVGLGVGNVLLNRESGVAHASGTELHPAEYDWWHQRFYGTFDHASLRRGFEVYRQVCSTCHSLDYIKWRNLIGVTHTLKQAKMMAEAQEVQDGPNDKGEMYMRPGQLGDGMKRPYPNEEFARYANNGANPPDLSLVRKARQPNGRGEDYIFSLLTGYRDAPAGITLRQGLYYNPYFPGGAIAMPPPLLDGQIDYEDATPATISQMAKDVSAFLTWAAEPESDRRKKMGCEALFAMVITTLLAGYVTRFRWSQLKTRRRSWAGPRYNMKTPPPRE